MNCVEGSYNMLKSTLSICAAVKEAESALACYNSINTEVAGQPIWAVAENYRFEPAFVEVYVPVTFFINLLS